jgi:hypothetical protein
MKMGDYTVVALTMTTKRKRALKNKFHNISRGIG